MKRRHTKVHIYISYVKKDIQNGNMERHQKLSEESKRKAESNSRKFICSICLNTRPKDQCKTCHICQRSCPTSHGQLRDRRVNSECDRKNTGNPNQTDTKTMQTSQTDVSKGLNLLNEVLNVFQTKKTDLQFNKTVILKDASVATDNTNAPLQKLTTSKIFQHSIESELVEAGNRNKFVIVSSSQPCYEKNSQFSIHLSRPKSCSIPQMKLEELKRSLKDMSVSKSKDAVEEVNRMFANVKKIDDNVDRNNRPITRLGPRVLPVVKTKHDEAKPKVVPSVERVFNKDCKCLNYNMSAGDSSKNVFKKCDDNTAVQILCCRRKQCPCDSPRDNVCACCLKRSNGLLMCTHENGAGRFTDSSR